MKLKSATWEQLRRDIRQVVEETEEACTIEDYGVVQVVQVDQAGADTITADGLDRVKRTLAEEGIE